MQQDSDFMQLAIEQAELAGQNEEVPIGAVVVYQGEVIASAYNQPIGLCDPTAHAEILALREAAEVLGNYRLLDTTVYVSIEPCAMCAMALVHARVKRLVYGAAEPRTGAVQSHVHLLEAEHHNHRVEVCAGVLAEPARELMRAFFTKRRKKTAASC